MKRSVNILLLTALLLGLPLLGIMLAGLDLSTYLEFPPRTRYVSHVPFSWPVFIGLALFLLAAVLPFMVCILTSRNKAGGTSAIRTAGVPPAKEQNKIEHPFPWWGTAGIILGIISWILAWTRFNWFSPLQPYTFTPLWIAYILTVNAITFRRTGRCLLTHRTRTLLTLFPLSAAFWWFFEYLNRFVQNWYYTAANDFTGLQYFIAATLPFSTVLPAVLSTEECLASAPRLTAGLDRFPALRFRRPRIAASVTLIVSCAGLLLIGRFPDQLFPLLWTAPLFLLISSFPFDFTQGRQYVEKSPRDDAETRAAMQWLTDIGNGDWRRVFRLCLAALLCGFFWEVWNVFSLAKWIYSVPYVDRFHLFEMPILGYSGYLPFGLECAVIAELFLGKPNTD